MRGSNTEEQVLAFNLHFDPSFFARVEMSLHNAHVTSRHIMALFACGASEVIVVSGGNSAVSEIMRGGKQ